MTELGKGGRARERYRRKRLREKKILLRFFLSESCFHLSHLSIYPYPHISLSISIHLYTSTDADALFLFFFPFFLFFLCQ